MTEILLAEVIKLCTEGMRSVCLNELASQLSVAAFCHWKETTVGS